MKTTVFLVLLLLHIEIPLFQKNLKTRVGGVWPSRLRSLPNMSYDIKRLYYCYNANDSCFVLVQLWRERNDAIVKHESRRWHRG